MGRHGKADSTRTSDKMGQEYDKNRYQAHGEQVFRIIKIHVCVMVGNPILLAI